MSEINLFCLPYAGGSAAIYSSWKSSLMPNVVLKPIELSGRGRRFDEALYKNIDHAVNDVLKIIRNEISKTPYALFGHSMGGIMVYELARKIREEQLRPPSHIFISGRSAPNIPKERKKFSQMPIHEFRKEVLNLGGTPKEFFEHPELLDLFLPILKNDFRLVETYNFIEQNSILDNNLSILIGEHDDLTKEQGEGWSMLTTNACSIHYFDGGHFFLNEKTEEVIAILNKKLKQSKQQRAFQTELY
ncbi:thioesterase II family protein [Aquimarina mytili]|uniref:Thioesterase n=1 Tax=Aquimarina mytili TaxID=874423 RepID=A0A936ZTC4_9FLAO|nr:thioesterase [Aquimarina mytili]MBL0685052.1 thioesterase [Aquimarina mytili]